MDGIIKTVPMKIKCYLVLSVYCCLYETSALESCFSPLKWKLSTKLKSLEKMYYLQVETSSLKNSEAVRRVEKNGKRVTATGLGSGGFVYAYSF